MHVAHQLFVENFTAMVDGVPAAAGDVFGDWAPHDRFGLVVDAPFGGLGASLLLQLAIAHFYAADPGRRSDRPAYPEIYLFHVGGPHGDFSAFDFWPPRKEVLLASNQPVTLLEAINDRAITRVALPDNDIGDIGILATGPSSWAEQASARDRLRSCLLYGPSGRVRDADVELNSTDPRVIDNVRSTMHLQGDAAELRAALASAQPPALPGPSVPSDIHSWADRVDQRLPEVSAKTRARVRVDDGRRQTYRRVGTETAMAHLAAL